MPAEVLRLKSGEEVCADCGSPAPCDVCHDHDEPCCRHGVCSGCPAYCAECPSQVEDDE